MVIKNIAKTLWWRWIIFLFIGILVKFLLDVSYSLMFRNYDFLQPIGDYFYAILLSIIALEVVHQFRNRIGNRIPWEGNIFRRFMTQWSISILAALTIVFVIRWLYTIVFNTVQYIRLIDEILLLVLIVLVITSMVMVEMSVYLLDKWRFSLAELERFKKENAEFQFESLRSQVNPHFLFNSLNTLSSLVYENQEKATAFIRELSDVYRYVLENRGKELVSLIEELTVARSYIYLMHLRFDKNLKIDVNIDSVYNSWQIPPLTLQLLIENAVKHNIISQRKPLNVSIFIENNKLVVSNNLQKKESKDYSSKLGLKNIQRRYSFLSEDHMDVKETENEFVVKIPLIQSV